MATRENGMRRVKWKQGVGLLASVGVLLFSLFAGAAVEDNAQLFSKEARDKANDSIREFQSQRRLQIVVHTQLETPAGTQASVLAESMLVQRKVSGFLVWIALKPKRQIVAVYSPEMGNLLPHPDEPRLKMLASFHKEDYDGGLDALLGELKTQVTQAKEARSSGECGYAVGRRMEAAERKRNVRRAWWFLAGVGGLVLVVVLLVRLGRRSTGTNGPTGGSDGSGYAGPSAGMPWGPSMGGGSTGGGWVKPVVGGIAGAMAGNWIYDQLTGRGQAHADAGSSGDVQHRDGWHGSDGGQVGGSFGGTGGDEWGAGADSDPGSSGGDDW